MKRKRFFHFGQTSKFLNYFVTDDLNKIPWPEIMYYVINVGYLMVVAYHSLLAFTEMGWITSLNEIKEGFNMSGDGMPLSAVAFAHHVIALVTILLVLIGVYGAYIGHKSLIYFVTGLMFCVILLEAYTSYRVGIRADHCLSNYKELKSALKFHVDRVYMDEKFEYFQDKSLDDVTGQAMIFPIYRRLHTSYFIMNHIQASLGCCGYDSYQDYLDPAKGVMGIRNLVNGSDSILQYEVPHSCCKRNYYHNIYCAAELDPDPEIIRKQIYTEGCASRVLEICFEIVEGGGRGAAVVGLVHFVLFLLSLPTIIIQIKILHKLSSESSFTFSVFHTADQEQEVTTHEKEEAEEKAYDYFQREFHRDLNFVLTEETDIFLRRLQQEHGIADEDVYKTVLVVKGDNLLSNQQNLSQKTSLAITNGQDNEKRLRRQSVASSSTLKQQEELQLPAFAMSHEDKSKLKKQEGRFHYFLNQQLLNYAAGVLNASPGSANAETLEDMKQAELVGKMNAFYKQVLDTRRRGEGKNPRVDNSEL